MTISLRSVKRLMQSVLPGHKVSEDAARMLKIHLEHKAEEIAVHALRVYDRENSMRDELGIRHLVFLSPEHMKMAIDGKYSKSLEGDHANSEH